MLDWDDEAIVLPYHHSNVQSEEVMYYVDGEYGARKGVDVGCITLHPSGLPHGPQPGLVEKAIGVKQTNELAVMCDTFRPLKLTTLSRDLDDPSYALSWYEPVHDFTWRDGERLIRFGRGCAAEAVELARRARLRAADHAARGGGACRRWPRRRRRCTTSGSGTVPPLAAAALAALPADADRYRRARRRPGDRRGQGGRRRARRGRTRDGGPDHAVGRGDDERAPARRGRRRVDAARALRASSSTTRRWRRPSRSPSWPRAR